MSTTTENNPLTGKAKYLALAAMMFATSMMFIDMTIVSLAAPDIEKDLGISDQAVQWVINGYLLALAATFAFWGRVADVVGPKRMVLIGVVVFAVSSAMCGFTPAGAFADAWIIGFRVTQGLGAAMMFPAALAVVVSVFAVAERGRALALFFAITGGLTAVGPIAGGYLTEISWRTIFWINIPIAIVALILTARIANPQAPRKEPIDWAGAVLVTIGMGLSVLGFQNASTWGWTSVATLGCIIVGIVFIVGFIFFERGREYPLIRITIFRDRAFFADNFVLFFSMMTFVPIFFFMSLYAQVVLGESTSAAGLSLMWYFLGFVIAAQVGGQLIDQIGSKIPMLLGSLVAAVGYAGWAVQVTALSASAIVPWTIVAGAGIGLLLGPASTDAVNRAINASYGEVTGITQTLRNYGSAVGMAILGTLMLTTVSSKLTTSLVGFGVPADQADSIVASISSHTSSGGGTADPATSRIPEAMRDQVLSAMKMDFALAIRAVLIGMVVMMVVSAVVALIHPGGKVEVAGTPAPDGDQPSAGKQLLKRLVIFAVVFAAIYIVISLL